MKVFVDTSVVLRVLLGQDNPIAVWGQWEAAYVSTLLRTEFLRTVDRLRLGGELSDRNRVALRQAFDIFWDTIYEVPLADAVLSRAEAPFPTVLGTLDALHLATLLLVQEHEDISLRLLTHDAQLGHAALACGVDVLGI